MGMVPKIPPQVVGTFVLCVGRILQGGGRGTGTRHPGDWKTRGLAQGLRGGGHCCEQGAGKGVRQTLDCPTRFAGGGMGPSLV